MQTPSKSLEHHQSCLIFHPFSPESRCRIFLYWSRQRPIQNVASPPRGAGGRGGRGEGWLPLSRELGEGCLRSVVLKRHDENGVATAGRRTQADFKPPQGIPKHRAVGSARSSRSILWPEKSRPKGLAKVTPTSRIVKCDALSRGVLLLTNHLSRVRSALDFALEIRSLSKPAAHFRARYRPLAHFSWRSFHFGYISIAHIGASSFSKRLDLSLLENGKLRLSRLFFPISAELGKFRAFLGLFWLSFSLTKCITEIGRAEQVSRLQ